MLVSSIWSVFSSFGAKIGLFYETSKLFLKIICFAEIIADMSWIQNTEIQFYFARGVYGDGGEE